MPSGGDTSSPLYKKFEKEVGGLSGQLFIEVSKLAKKFYDDTLLGRDRLLRRSLVHFEKIRAKLGGLAFLDNRVTPLISAIDETLQHVQGDGPVSGLELSAIHGLTLTLCDVQRMKSFGQAMLDGAPASNAWGVSLPTKSVGTGQAVASVVEKPSAAKQKVTKAIQQDVVPTGIKPAGYIPNLFDDDPLLAAAFGVAGKPVANTEMAQSKPVIPEQKPVQPHVRVVPPKRASKPEVVIPSLPRTPKVIRPITF